MSELITIRETPARLALLETCAKILNLPTTGPGWRQLVIERVLAFVIDAHVRSASDK